MAKRYYSEASMVCHQSARDLYEIGAITADRMKEFDEMCLVSKAEPAHEDSIMVEINQSAQGLYNKVKL